MDNLAKIRQINQHLTERFPTHNEPFHILARLMEECGELAEQVHIFEAVGIKRQKHGAPSHTQLAKEIQDVLRVVLQLTEHYDLWAELDRSIDRSFANIS